MSDRSAVDTIRGYFYQFDLSILSLLRLADGNDSIEVECIEDIDIRTASAMSAVQCKYYAKTEYNHSVIKEAVMYMLSHFKEVKLGNKPKIKYILNGHYASGQDKLSKGIDVEFLKRHFLTYTTNKVEHYHHTELGLDDNDLANFLSVLTVDIHAPELEKQFQDVIDHLEVEFNCKPFSAEFFYYNNALRVIRELSIQSDPVKRTITKKQFLERVDTASILFNEWFVERKGKKHHLAALRAEYFTTLNISPFERFFLIEVDTASYVRDELKDLLFALSKKWAKLSRLEPSPFCPYVFIQGIAEDELVSLKRDLHMEGFKFVDGYDYKGAVFDPNSIAQKASYSNGIKIKILNTLNDLKATLVVVTKTRKVFQFHFGKSYFEYNNPSVGHVRIQIEQLSDIKAVI
ncbi:hypothetical protein FSO04_33240 [Paraburkholderia madseniana]|uniref:Uncharacterized protein n=1 Tax=Paraburkholderia madseniana TaxID=2599607 RepID=A0A6N6W4T6_9BURK|nr:DUF4297 family anti-phage-associated protein [Paraburkholderia madseniana]KAE8755632.1 hypothetical protein FSO04_33240 [Paraburkholderia madseniana]